jgi:hypothetical protein
MFQNAEGTPGFPYPNPLDYLEQEPPRPATHFQTINWPGRGAFQAEPDETNEAIVLVHGWNMTDPDRRTFSESFFKRLWWKGYKGLFASFAWPTYNVDHDFQGWIPDHYNKSEYVGWKYGPALKAYMDSISKSSKHLAAHSMGNIVVASALKAGLRPSSYVAMEAAIPAGVYDSSFAVNSYQDFLDEEETNPTPNMAIALGYRGLMDDISGGGSNFHNFFSANDFALKTGTTAVIGRTNWESNQIDHKPNWLYYYFHRPDASGTAKNRRESGWAWDPQGRDITDHHEVMSFIARPRSEALGARIGNTSGFTPFNLATIPRYPFGTDRTEHSGQYQRPIQKTNMFFNTLLDSMDVGFNFLDDSSL